MGERIAMSEWKFSCEWKPEIPLPPEYMFPQAFNYLNSENNSFYILEHENGNYIQCGGSKKACTVELRIYDRNGSHKHYVVGHRDGSTDPATVQMSDGVVNVQQREVLNHWEAIDLFKGFFAGEDVPADYVLRETDI